MESRYRCPACGMESSEEEECGTCLVDMEKVCDECGAVQSKCSCNR